MGQLMVFVVYPTQEACVELASRAGWPRPYSRQRLSDLIKRHLPCVERIGGQYFLREAEIEFLANIIQKDKRAKLM